jgi:hypothetical protein
MEVVQKLRFLNSTIAKNYCIDVIRKSKYITSIPIKILDKQKLINYDIGLVQEPI